MTLRSILVAMLLMVAADSARTQSRHTHNPMPNAIPQETGQSAFAAIAEIVALLENDPNTDWSRVNIDELREHLVDMNELALRTTASITRISGGVELIVSGEGRTVEAIRRMVPAHAAELAKRPHWETATERTEDGVVLRVVSSDPNDATKIYSLGFFGLMALENHHQNHHWLMATGHPPRGH